MPNYALPDHARRLDEILRELGYRDAQDRIAFARAAGVINRWTMRPFPEERLRALAEGKGAEMTAREAGQIAEGLKFDARRLLYDEVPKCFPQSVDLMEMMREMFGRDKI